MEELKALSEIHSPDVRQASFVLVDPVTNSLRPIGVEDFHAWASEIRLHEGVPDDVRSHFATALNLLVYSCFYYPFSVTAQFLAYVSVEFALRKRYRVEQYVPFRRLVARAVEEGLVQDKRFSHIGERDFHDPEIRHLPPELRAYAFDEPAADSYVQVLLEYMPNLRNDLAHGSPMLHPHGASSVRVCADFINQLFEPPRPES